jgi:hypothetical protein
MKILSIFFTIIFTLLLITPIKAQAPKLIPSKKQTVQESPKTCTLGLANAPNLRGLKLGMTSLQVEKTIGLKLILKDYKPYMTDEIIPEIKDFRFSSFKNNAVPTQLEGVDAVFFKFYNNSLYRIFVIYAKPTVAWKDNNEFASYLSEKFDLPKDAWTQNRYLSCAEFTLSINIEEEKPSISLTNKKIGELATAKESKLVEKYKPKRRVLEIQNEKGFKP